MKRLHPRRTADESTKAGEQEEQIYDVKRRREEVKRFPPFF
jgi:hypothetical protein